jgi:hypothetical protein
MSPASASPLPEALANIFSAIVDIFSPHLKRVNDS